jgi:alkanesulfonate monooxygenase SsuD/methylene tetrahydromethanopterin reductase-like flavin-dependent oxidoreductase (luciferase family)
VSSPAVVLAAIAARTSAIRLTSAVTVLSALDPVRVYQDFATVDLLSHGRAELVVGRSAYAEPFALFGEPYDEYDALYAEKLDLLLRLCAEERITWSGRYRRPLVDAPVTPRALQHRLPVWAGVGGGSDSAERAGRLGLPLVRGFIGGTIDDARRTVDAYRAAGEAAGHGDRLRVGLSTHLFVGATPAEARATYPYYREYLRPKAPGARGVVVEPDQFAARTQGGQSIMVGSAAELVERILHAHEVLGLDRFMGQVDWGGLPPELVEASITRFATEVAPAVRTATASLAA